MLVLSVAADGKGTVNASVLNIRSGPGTNYNNIGQLSRGSEVSVVKIENNWIQIRLPQGLGWVSSEYVTVSANPTVDVTPAPSVQGAEVLTGKTGVINSTVVNVRKEPGTESQTLGQLSRGELVQLQQKKDDWYYVKSGKVEGWVAGFLITVQGEGVDTRTYYVNQNVVNMRSEPNLNAEIISQLNRNTPVTVKNQRGDWYQVVTKEQKEGWIAGWLLSQADGSSVLKDPGTGAVIYPQNPETAPSGITESGIKVNDNIIIKESVVNVRQGPGIEYGIITTVKAGQGFAVIDAEKNWLKIKLPSGNAGWIADWLVFKKEDSQETQRQDISFDENNSAKISLGSGKFFIITNSQDFLEIDILPVSIEDYRLSKPSATQIIIDFPELNLTPQKVYVNQFNIGTVEVASKKITINFLDKIDFRASYEKENQGINIRLRNYAEALSTINNITINEEADRFNFEIFSEKEISYESKRLSLDQIAFFIKGSRLDINGSNTFNKTINGNYQITAKQDSQDVVRVDLKFIYGSSVRVNLKEKSLNVAVGYPTQGPRGKIVVIDPGHGTIKAGGWVDPGAIGKTLKVRELNVNIPISLKVEEYLRREGVEVILTHRGTTNRDLYDRANLANNENAYCFVSIHANATANRAIQGIGVFYYAPEWMPEIFMQRLERQNLATYILDEALRSTGRPSYGIFEENFAVIRETRMPSVLVETGFLTNQQEEQLLSSPAFQDQIASGIAKGILKFLNQ
jgi:N-acetylmuramoyl-L-alanine amidase